jgi:hypothetical protein
MAVHSILPPDLTAAVAEVLDANGIAHVAHGDSDPVGAAENAASDPRARAVIGPFRSADVNDALAATAPARLPLLAPAATWAGITRDDEPGCDDAAQPDGTVFRLVARDTVVAQRIAERLADQRALVIAGDHDYGLQLDGQLRMGGLRRAEAAEDADVIVLAGLVGEPEIEAARRLAPKPIVAFDGIQPEPFPDQDVTIALVYAPGPVGVAEARRAAEMVSRTSDLEALRAMGFDDHGDPIEPPVYFQPYEP